jgi:hypothetical protein
MNGETYLCSRTLGGVTRTQQPTTNSIQFASIGSESPVGQSRSQWHVWLAKPNRTRTEFQVGGHTVAAIVIGDTWWSSSSGGLRTNEGDPSLTHGFGPAEALIDPGRLLPSLNVEFGGEVEFLGCQAFSVKAQPKLYSDAEASVTATLLGAGADSYEFVVDGESGVLLRLEADLQASAFRVLVVQDIKVNRPLSDSTFDPSQLRSAMF